MGDTTAQIHVDVIDIVDDGRDIDNNNKMHGATNSPSTRANDCIDEFFYMFCDIMTGRDDTYLQIYDGQRRRLEYNKFAPRELYAISMVSRTAYSLCRAKLDKWRRLYNKYRRYFAESFHNHITQSMRFKHRRLTVSKYMDMYAPIHHDLLGPCLIDHHTFKDTETDYVVGLYGLTLWFARPGSFELSITIERTRDFILVCQGKYTADDFIFENDMWIVNCFSWRSNPITIFMQNMSRICMTVTNTFNEMPTWVVTEFGYDKIFEQYDTTDIIHAAGGEIIALNREALSVGDTFALVAPMEPSTDDDKLQNFIKFKTPNGYLISSNLSPKFIPYIKNDGVFTYTPRLIFSGTFMSKPPDYYKWYLLKCGYQWHSMQDLFTGEAVTIDIIAENITTAAVSYGGMFTLLVDASQHE